MLKIKTFLVDHGFWPDKQDVVFLVSLVIFVTLLGWSVNLFYTHQQIQSRLGVVESLSMSLFQSQRALDGRLGMLEAKHDNQRRALFAFIHDKHPTIDSMYSKLLVDTIINYSEKFQHIYPMLLVSLIWYESSFDTLAVSHKNAQGIMQILPSTAQEVVVQHNLSTDYDLLTLTDNIRIGCLYLNNLIARYGEFNALSHYNAGRVSNVGRWYATQVTRFGIEGLELSSD